MEVLVIGGSGLVGTNIIDICHQQGMDVCGTYFENKTQETQVQLDKTDKEDVKELIQNEDPDLIIDTAAFHNVDECEHKRTKAFDVNAVGTRNIATEANKVDAHYIYLSTDYVFPGYPYEAPYAETDRVKPLNYYAETKYSGEQAAKIANKYTILRPSVIYGIKKPNFVTWALDELREGNEITIVDDQVSSPTYAPDIARASIDIGNKEITGTYHSTGPSSISRYEFTCILAKTYKRDDDLVKPITTEELGQDAPRPENSTLNSNKLYSKLGWDFKPPTDGFKELGTADR